MPTAISVFVGFSLKFKFFSCKGAEILVYVANKSDAVIGDQECLCPKAIALLFRNQQLAKSQKEQKHMEGRGPSIPGAV